MLTATAIVPAQGAGRHRDADLGRPLSPPHRSGGRRGLFFLLDLPAPTELREGLGLSDGQQVEIRAAVEPLMAPAPAARCTWRGWPGMSATAMPRPRSRQMRCCCAAIMCWPRCWRASARRWRRSRPPFCPEGGAYGRGRLQGHGHGHEGRGGAGYDHAHDHPHHYHHDCRRRDADAAGVVLARLSRRGPPARRGARR